MSAKKWRILEGVVAAIERSLNAVPGTSVIPNAAVPVRGSKTTRQVDVLVEIPTGSRKLRIGVEVRDKATPLDVTQVEQLGTKLSNLELDRKCVVSSSGFTSGAKEEAVRLGVELRTIAEVGAIDWWLPTSVLVHSRRVELLRWRLNYAPEQLESIKKTLAGAGAEDLYLVSPDGSNHLLRSIVEAQGVSAVDLPEHQHLNDQDVFTVTVEMKMPDSWFLNCPSGRLPLPRTISAAFRLHRQEEFVPITAYQIEESINAFSGVSNVESKQLTLIVQLQDDGSRRLSVSFADAVPKRTRVEPIADGDDRA